VNSKSTGSDLGARILDVWFGPLDESGNSLPEYQKRWFSKDPAFDQQIREEFAATYVSLAVTQHLRPAWLAGPRGLLAGVIVLDQFSRNMFRNSPAMYSADDLARSFAYELIALGYDRKLPLAFRGFAYLPLMHSERLVDQERCVELFEEFARELGADARKDVEARKGVEANLKYAILHRDIVARFGRFPHRNELLSRASTEEELEFLTTPGSSF
jgi:uncharacterized protein (DUF924 family)